MLHDGLNANGGWYAIALALLLVLALPSNAAAESCVVPAGAESPCTAGARLSSALFCVERKIVDGCNAEKALNEKLQAGLESCAQELEQKQDEEDEKPGWGGLLAASGATFAVGFAAGVLMAVMVH